jgi:hypothetical protein
VYGNLSGIPIVGALKCTESSKQSDSYMTKQEEILRKIEEENKKQYLLPEMIPKKDEVVVEYGRFMPVLPEVKMQENASLHYRRGCHVRIREIMLRSSIYSRKNRYFRLSLCIV